MKTFSAMWSTELDREITAAALEQCPDGYPVEVLADSRDFDSLQAAVNQGIDAHLEAVSFTEFDGDYGKRGFRFAPETLHVLVRRLMDSDDAAQMLASNICDTLGIELI